MTEEFIEKFDLLDDFELKKDQSYCKKKTCIIITTIIILIILLAAAGVLYFLIFNVKCEIGEEEKCLSCNKKQCSSCNPGYKLSGGKCIIDYSIKAEYYTEEVSEIKLIKDGFSYAINELIIDGEITERCTKYTFNSTGKHKVYFKLDITETDTLQGIFSGINNVTSISFSPLFNTENIKYMNEMFENCNSLTSINISSFNTKNVNDMHRMFQGVRSLESVDLSNFNLEKVEMMDAIFAYSNIKFVNLSNINASNLVRLHSGFYGCTSLTSVDFHNFYAPKLWTLELAFQNCISLKEVDFTNFYTESLGYLANAFNNCTSLKSIEINSFNVTSTDYAYNMFYNCISLTSVNLKNFNLGIGQNSMHSMFYECPNLTYIDISSFWNRSSKVDLFNVLPPKGEIIVNSNFINAVSDQIPPGWKKIIIEN